MFRSAIVAVLAVALSSSAAAAQSADSVSAIDIVSANGFDTTPPAAPHDWDVDALGAAGFDLAPPTPVELTDIASAFELIELAQAPHQSVESTATPFLKKTEMMFTRHIDRAQVFFTKARLNASTMLTMARNQPRFGLYAAQGTLQALDIFTTGRALDAGHNEANPLFKSGNRTAMVLAKSASFGLSVYLTERLAERRPKAAKWLMVATNAFMSVVVVNNLAIGGSPAR